MALDKTSLKNELKQLFQGGSNDADQMAQGIADAIEKFVKSGTVTSNGQTGPCVPYSPASINGLQGSIN